MCGRTPICHRSDRKTETREKHPTVPCHDQHGISPSSLAGWKRLFKESLWYKVTTLMMCFFLPTLSTLDHWTAPHSHTQPRAAASTGNTPTQNQNRFSQALTTPPGHSANSEAHRSSKADQRWCRAKTFCRAHCLEQHNLLHVELPDFISSHCLRASSG